MSVSTKTPWKREWKREVAADLVRAAGKVAGSQPAACVRAIAHLMVRFEVIDLLLEHSGPEVFANKLDDLQVPAV